jgi:hypothetical protein
MTTNQSAIVRCTPQYPHCSQGRALQGDLMSAHMALLNTTSENKAELNRAFSSAVVAYLDHVKQCQGEVSSHE